MGDPPKKKNPYMLYLLTNKASSLQLPQRTAEQDRIDISEGLNNDLWHMLVTGGHNGPVTWFPCKEKTQSKCTQTPFKPAV